MKKNLFSILLVTFSMACATAGLPEKGTPEANLYIKKCTSCHSWAHPARHTKQEWDHYLALMKTHMEKKGIPFSVEEKEIIQSYLYRNAR